LKIESPAQREQSARVDYVLGVLRNRCTVSYFCRWRELRSIGDRDSAQVGCYVGQVLLAFGASGRSFSSSASGRR
jgi:hypothetical protein